MIKLNWRQTNRRERPQNQDVIPTGNIIKLEKPAEYLRWPETRTYVQLLEAIIRQRENSAHADKIPELRHTIELIKDSNRQYAINW